jgi:hypothetical protein
VSCWLRTVEERTTIPAPREANVRCCLRSRVTLTLVQRARHAEIVHSFPDFHRFRGVRRAEDFNGCLRNSHILRAVRLDSVNRFWTR